MDELQWYQVDELKELSELEYLYESALTYKNMSIDVYKKAYDKSPKAEMVRTAASCIKRHGVLTPGQLISLMNFIDS